MSVPPIAADTLAIVVLGDVNQVGISSSWLLERQLIGDAEAVATKVELLLPNEVSVFQSGWLRCLFRRGQLEVQTQQQAESERLRDVVVGILKMSSNASIAALGINRTVHFATENVRQWNAIGDSLVNHSIWDGLLPLPGMRSVVYWCGRKDNYAGRIQVQIEPSTMVPYGIFVAYNDHYDLTKLASQPTTRAEAQAEARTDNTDSTEEKVSVAIEVLNSNWETSMKLTDAIIERVWEQGRSVK